MIAFVRGTVQAMMEDGVVIDIGGIGLLVHAPLAMMSPRPVQGQELFLYTYTHIREDNWQLFGFSTQEQLEIFRFLIGVSGIGAKTALGVINTLNPSTIASAVVNNDHGTFCSVPGIGKKTAQRLALELKDKIAAWSGTTVVSPSSGYVPASNDAELLAALGQLGYGASESRSLAMQAMSKLGNEAETNQLLKEALRLAAKG